MQIWDAEYHGISIGRIHSYNDGVIQLNGKRFELPSCLPGSRVSVRYLPWDPNWVYYGELMQPARPLNTAANAKRFNHPKGGCR
jgi:hypothetical protein